VTSESTREIDRLCVRLEQAEAEVQRLKTALVRIAAYEKTAGAEFRMQTHSNLSSLLCRIARNCLEAEK
jgi:hypothetical protein